MEGYENADLDFLNTGAEDVLRWDREWARYFSVGPSSWFTNLAGSTDRMAQFKEELRGLDRAAVFEFEGPLDRLQLHIDSADLIDRQIGEIGCGAGRLGRQLGHIATDYVGADHSKLAVSVAQPLSPSNCRYICLQDGHLLRKWHQTRDIIVCRHFFIHNNLETATTVLNLAKFLLRTGGLIVADFYAPATAEEQEKGEYRTADDELDERSPSRSFLFTEGQIKDMARATGFAIEEMYVHHFTDYHDKMAARRITRLRSITSTPRVKEPAVASAAVDASLTAKTNRKREIKDELENSSLTDEDRSDLEDELYQIESFLWLARGGDRLGESPPERKTAE